MARHNAPLSNQANNIRPKTHDFSHLLITNAINKTSYVCDIKINEIYLHLQIKGKQWEIDKNLGNKKCMPIIRQLPIVLFSMSLNSIEKLYLYE